MPSITREQVQKINSKLANGWELDIRYYLIWGEKTAQLTIPQEDGGYIQGKLYIDKVQDWHPGAYNGIQIKLNVSRWRKGLTEGTFTSAGLGRWIVFNRPDLTRALFSEVQKMTHEITAADVLSIAAGHAAELESARIL